MNAKKFCLVIVASSLVFYAVVSVLAKSKFTPFNTGRNLSKTQFLRDNNKDDVPTQTRSENARLSSQRPSQVSQPRVSSEHRPKYNISLPPEFYAINRPAATANSIAVGLARKSITQHDAAATIVKKLGDAVKRFPTTLIIGVRKAGTRALLAILRLHPQVKSCGPEVHYFDQNYPRGLRWYLDQTPKIRAGQQTIEKTPSYFVVRGVPQRILDYSKAINRSLKFLVIFRDPTVRAISDYVQLNVGTQEKYNKALQPFETMVIKNRSSFEINTSWGVVKTGVYSKHLERWFGYFPREWFHFVNGEELVSNPFREIKKVEGFLELKPYFRKSNFVFNEQKGFPCFRASANKNERCLGKTKGRTHPSVNPRILNELRTYYRPFNEELYKMTNRNFSWPWYELDKRS